MLNIFKLSSMSFRVIHYHFKDYELKKIYTKTINSDEIYPRRHSKGERGFAKTKQTKELSFMRGNDLQDMIFNTDRSKDCRIIDKYPEFFKNRQLIYLGDYIRKCGFIGNTRINSVGSIPDGIIGDLTTNIIESCEIKTTQLKPPSLIRLLCDNKLQVVKHVLGSSNKICMVFYISTLSIDQGYIDVYEVKYIDE